MDERKEKLDQLINGLTYLANDQYTLIRSERDQINDAIDILRNIKSAIKFCEQDDKNKRFVKLLYQLLRKRESKINDKKVVHIGR